MTRIVHGRLYAFNMHHLGWQWDYWQKWHELGHMLSSEITPLWYDYQLTGQLSHAYYGWRQSKPQAQKIFEKSIYVLLTFNLFYYSVMQLVSPLPSSNWQLYAFLTFKNILERFISLLCLCVFPVVSFNRNFIIPHLQKKSCGYCANNISHVFLFFFALYFLTMFYTIHHSILP